MTLEDMMQLLLYRSCSNPCDDGWNQYRIELCCEDILVIARPNPDTKRYEIKGWHHESDLWEANPDRPGFERLRSDPHPIRTTIEQD